MCHVDVIAICKIESIRDHHLEIDVSFMSIGMDATACRKVLQGPVTEIVPFLM
jgi:hypothetical protein